MTQANEPNDSPEERRQQQGVDARLARLEERLSRIERTTVPNDYIRRSFDRVYQDMTDLHYKIDSLAIEVDTVKQSNQRLEQKIDDVSNELNGKLDVIIRRLTGMS
jgi:septation ring formation regulator EzrA